MRNKINENKIALFFVSFRAGGGERVMVELANGFARDGFDVDICIIKPVGQYKNQVDSRVNIVNLDTGRIIFSLPKLILYLRKERPKIILSLDEYTHIMSLIGTFISRSGTKSFLRVGNMFSVLFDKYKRIRDKMIPIISRNIYKYASGIIANSFGVADDVVKVFRVNRDKIEVINNPKDLNNIKNKSKLDCGHVWLDNKDRPVILFFGRLREQKDLPTLIKAFAKIQKETNSRLLFVGVGREQKRLEDLIKELGLEKEIDFFGFADNPYSFASKADVFISTSLWEGMSNSIIEAMVCGAPIIATDCNSGSREILAPDTDPLFRMSQGIEYAKYGILVPVGDTNEIANSLKQVLTDSELREKYKQRSLERSENFGLEIILNKYKNILSFK